MAIGGVAGLDGYGTTIPFAFNELLGMQAMAHRQERLDILILHRMHVLFLMRELQSLIRSAAGRSESGSLLLF